MRAKIARATLVFAFLSLLSAVQASAQSPFTLLHTFTGTAVPNSPSWGLVDGGDGYLYGLTCAGGHADAGTAFRMTLSGVVTTLYEFDPSTGFCPERLVAVGDGTFMGVVATGPPYYPRLFGLTREGEVTFLESFPSRVFVAALISASDGNLYAAADESIYRVTRQGAITVLRTFDASVLTVMQAADGYLYAVTGYPTYSVVRIGLNGFATTLHTVTADEGKPSGFATLVQGTDGNLYGTTDASDSGGNTLFKMDLAGNFTLLKTFEFVCYKQGGSHCQFANQRVTVTPAPDGALYGAFGSRASVNEVFRLTTSGQYQVLHELGGFTAEGSEVGPLTLASNGQFYGTTLGGPTGLGTVFRLSTGGEFTSWPLAGAADGAKPDAPLIPGADGAWYGVTTRGGRPNGGTAFKMTGDGVVTILHEFDGQSPEGQWPDRFIQSRDGNFYGVTTSGGANGRGTIFRMSLDGLVTVLHSFGSFEWPSELIEGTDGNFYGMTRSCCASISQYPQPPPGSVFVMSPSGVVTVLHRFGGDWPVGLIQGTDGYFYGTTEESIFRMSVSGDVTVLRTLGEEEGYLRTPLVQGTDGNLYGTTAILSNSSPFTGLAFRIRADGAFTVLHRFTQDEGIGSPTASLLQASDGNFYGVASTYNDPTRDAVFRMTSDGTTTVLHSFTGTDGWWPAATLAEGRDGQLYGTTYAGGFIDGVIFRLRVPTLATRLQIDAPAQRQTVKARFTLSGWALDRSATAPPGIDAIHVYAFRLSNGVYGPGTFLGDATYGLVRPDVAAIFGDAFAGSGYSLTVSSLEPGSYRLGVYVRSALTGAFEAQQIVDVDVAPAVSEPVLIIDTPTTNTVSNASFTMAGWAADLGAVSGVGVDAVHVYAFPINDNGFGAATLLGAAALGAQRTDVGAAFGAQFTASGFALRTPALAPGRYRIAAYGHSTVSGAFGAQGFVDITVSTPQPMMAVDTPVGGEVAQPVAVSGWAIDFAAQTGTGVDAVHVWAYPTDGGAPLFAGAATLGVTRNDVAAVFGAQFASAGYQLMMPTLPAGEYDIAIYAHSTVADAFNQVRVVRIDVD